jgi:hypothetical protein
MPSTLGVPDCAANARAVRRDTFPDEPVHKTLAGGCRDFRWIQRHVPIVDTVGSLPMPSGTENKHE